MLPLLLWSLLALNLATFVVYGIDKSRARADRWRIPEAWLLGLGFFGGFPAAWLAMSFFRHKTRKTSFRVRLILLSLASPVWVLGWLWWRGSLTW